MVYLVGEGSLMLDLFFGMKHLPEETTREKDEKILHMNSWKGIAP